MDVVDECTRELTGPLGLCTLHHQDADYRGDYDPSNDSDDFHTASGANYHQGPVILIINCLGMGVD